MAWACLGNLDSSVSKGPRQALQNVTDLSSRDSVPDERDVGVNSLSGSIWKGVKVRVGDAKPDFDQRCAVFSVLNSVEPDVRTA
jgi:hypothetical protein